MFEFDLSEEWGNGIIIWRTAAGGREYLKKPLTFSIYSL
jgi:hypothetical protein